MLCEQPFLIGGGATWLHVWDGNATAAAIYDRHYSRNPASRGDPRIAGPGEKMVLLTPCARALFVWRKFISKDGQQGINCAIFRNEGAGRSSDLIRAAMAAAWVRWPGARFYTYVNPRRVRSANPGYCFKAAGWRVCGVTKTRRLLILEATPDLCWYCKGTGNGGSWQGGDHDGGQSALWVEHACDGCDGSGIAGASAPPQSPPPPSHADGGDTAG